jgi:hypothetical protein
LLRSKFWRSNSRNRRGSLTRGGNRNAAVAAGAASTGRKKRCVAGVSLERGLRVTKV